MTEAAEEEEPPPWQLLTLLRMLEWPSPYTYALAKIVYKKIQGMFVLPMNRQLVVVLAFFFLLSIEAKDEKAKRSEREDGRTNPT